MNFFSLQSRIEDDVILLLELYPTNDVTSSGTWNSERSTTKRGEEAKNLATDTWNFWVGEKCELLWFSFIAYLAIQIFVAGDPES